MATKTPAQIASKHKPPEANLALSVIFTIVVVVVAVVILRIPPLPG